MRATVIRTAFAVAVAVPMVLALGQSPAGAYHHPSEDSCNDPYGAVTDQPAPNNDCMGMRFRDGRYGGDWDGYGDGGRWRGDDGPWWQSGRGGKWDDDSCGWNC